MDKGEPAPWGGSKSAADDGTELSTQNLILRHQDGENAIEKDTP